MSQHLSFSISPSKKNEPSHKSVINRLLELLKLEDGWLDGEGKSLSKQGVRQFANSFEAYFDNNLPEPHIFPTPEGNLQAEWAINNHNISLNVDLSNQSAFYLASSNKNEESDEVLLNLTQEQSWQHLNQKLTTHFKN